MLIGSQLTKGFTDKEDLLLQGQRARNVGDFNSKMANIDAQQELDKGRERAQEQGRLINQLAGEQAAGYAGQGIDLASGSVQRTIEGSRELGQRDVDLMTINSRRKALGLRQEGDRSRLYGRLGQEAKRKEAAMSPVTGAYKAAQTFMQFGDVFDPVDKGDNKGKKKRRK